MPPIFHTLVDQIPLGRDRALLLWELQRHLTPEGQRLLSEALTSLLASETADDSTPLSQVQVHNGAKGDRPS